MKTKILFIAFTALAVICGCTKDPWAGVEEGSWNNDHKILDIKFAGQAGNAVVKDVDSSTGIITLQLATNLVEDMSKVKIETLNLSYKATATVQRGGTIDFTGAAPTITVTSATGKTRTYTIAMTEFTETLIGKYKITGSKVWGGTGPEWGGGELVDPSVKSWCWYMDKGFGPNAEYDDYLEITLDEIMADGNTTGKCVHYGGVDGKHWNCLFLASQNKEGSTDVDLHKFYRQIPVGTSTWTRNYADNTISFTSDQGKVTTCKLLTEDIDVYEGKTLTVPAAALQFNLNGVDDWTNIYSDYDKFVKRPRSFFVLIEPVAEIPAESATQGTEGDNTVEPPAPAPAFELAGDWKLKSIWVYGGATGCIGKDDLFTKTWDWNGTLNNELDNILTFTPDEEGSASGKFLYGPGNDGKYWDYLWIGKKSGTAVNIDCTQWYGWLPHTESTYAFHPDDKSQSEAGSIDFKKGAITYTTPLLLPGSYTFLGLSALNILEGCIGIVLPISDTPSSNTSYQWTDYDKFVNSPLMTISIFEKQVPAE